MTKRNTAKQQMGFFDLGFSLAILALSGVSAYAITPDHDDSIAAQVAQIEVVANLEAGNGSVDPTE